MDETDDDEEPDLSEWEKPAWENAKQIVSGDNFRRLPDKFEIHEWAILEKFSRSVESERIREELMKAIHGRGAFRMFKGCARWIRRRSPRRRRC